MAYRDDVNPYEDIDWAVGRDSPVDSVVSDVAGFIQVPFFFLSLLVQAESPLGA